MLKFEFSRLSLLRPFGFFTATRPRATTPSSPSTCADYGNVRSEGEPVPGHSRGVVPYQGDYMNTRPARNLWYDRLQLFRRLAIEWLRNTWGNVDEIGMCMTSCNASDMFLSHTTSWATHPKATRPGVEWSNKTYSTLERPAAVILPTESENTSTTENVWSIRVSKYRTLVLLFIETCLLFPIICMIDCRV
jgi:hypothetical protein